MPAPDKLPRLIFTPYFSYWFVAIIFLAISLPVFFAHEIPYTGYESDGIGYMQMSRSLGRTPFWISPYGGGIGMPLAIKLAHFIFPDIFFAAKAVSLVSGVLFVLLSVSVMGRTFDPVTGILTGILLSVNPSILLYSSVSLSDMLGAVLPLLSLRLLLGEKRARDTFLSGLFLGLAWTTRPVTICFFPLPVIYFAFLKKDKKILADPKFILISFGILAGMSPQLWANYVLFKNPFYTENWRNIAIGLYGWTTAAQPHSFLEMVGQDPFGFMLYWIKQFLIVIPRNLLNAAYLPFLVAVPGYFLALRQSKPSGLLVVIGLGALAYLSLLALVWRLEPRYFMVLLPLIFASAVYAWRYLFPDRKWLLGIGLLIALGSSSAASIKTWQDYKADEYRGYKLAGEFLHQTAGPGQMILAARPDVGFYAEKNPLLLFSRLGASERKNLESAVVKRNIRWIVYDVKRGLKEHPQFYWLLEPGLVKQKRLNWSLAFQGTVPYKIVVWKTFE